MFITAVCVVFLIWCHPLTGIQSVDFTQLFSFLILAQMIQKNKKRHVLWSSEEKGAVFQYLTDAIREKRIPGKQECENCIKKSKPALDNRTWTAVKYYVKNLLSRSERLRKKKVAWNKTLRSWKYLSIDVVLIAKLPHTKRASEAPWVKTLVTQWRDFSEKRLICICYVNKRSGTLI